MQIGIIEDNKTQAQLLKSMVSKWVMDTKLPCEILCYGSAEKFLFAKEDENPFDILLLDIQMDKMSGVDLAKKLRLEHDDVIIIFITAVKDYVFDGYDVNALHYLLKPVDEGQLYTCLDKAQKQLKTIETYVIVNNTKLLQKDILYIEAQAHYINIVTKSDTYVVKSSLKEFYDELDTKSFYFCHRSYVVNLVAVKKILKDAIVLDNDKCIPVSRGKYKEINSAFIGYYKGEF